jgi:hypothetical protein
VTAADAHRSMAKYVALALGDPWEVRLAVMEGDWIRPLARVTPSTAISTVPIGAHHVEWRLSFAIVAFPALTLDAESGAVEAAGVADSLVRAFAGPGAHTPAYSARSGRGHPRRVPLWNFTGVPLTQAAPESARDPRDFARLLEGPNVQTAPDPNDDAAFVVTCDVRLSWTRAISVGFPQPIAETVGASPKVTP